MKYFPQVFLFFAFLTTGCIGDDILFDTVAERLTIENRVDSLQINSSHQLTTRYNNELGISEDHTAIWISLTQNTASVDESGVVTGLALGPASITASVNGEAGPLHDTINFVVTEDTTILSAGGRSGTIESTSSYVLTGDFTLEEMDGELVLSIEDNYMTTDALPGLYIYLTNNPSTNANAFEIGEVKVFSGAHKYRISGVTIDEYDYILYYCKPFAVKVGEGKIE